MDNGDGRDGAKLLAKLLRLGRDDVTVLVRLACNSCSSNQWDAVETNRQSPLTDDAGDALVAWYRLPMIAPPPLKRLRELHRRLELLLLVIQLLDATLGNH